MIVLTAPGQVQVQISGLPIDKVTLYGLLDVAREALREIVEQNQGKIIMPALGASLEPNGGQS